MPLYFYLDKRLPIGICISSLSLIFPRRMRDQFSNNNFLRDCELCQRELCLLASLSWIWKITFYLWYRRNLAHALEDIAIRTNSSRFENTYSNIVYWRLSIQCWLPLRHTIILGRRLSIILYKITLWPKYMYNQ